MKKVKLFSPTLIAISICILACESESNNNFLDSAKLDPDHYKVEFENDKV